MMSQLLSQLMGGGDNAENGEINGGLGDLAALLNGGGNNAGVNNSELDGLMKSLSSQS